MKHYKFLVIRLPDGAMLTFNTKDPSLVGLLTKMKKKAHKPPSRIKYDESHPTLSVRVGRALYDELQELRELSNKSRVTFSEKP